MNISRVHIVSRRLSAFAYRMRFFAICIAVLIGTATVTHAGNPSWEMVSNQVDIDDADRIETTVRDGYIFITTGRAVTVRLYSIVGQLICQQNINAGTSRLKVGTRGVYVLKIGSATRRITV